MALTFTRLAVVGATGPTGRTLASELVGRGLPVRVVSRRIDHLEALFPASAIEKRAGDALDSATLAAALEGCDLVVDCIGLPNDRMANHPVTARNIAEWIKASGSRCLQVSSYWSFMPIQQLPLSERHPRAGGPAWVRLRREAEDILLEAGSAIVHLPDFFGPHVHASVLQNALLEALDGKPMNWLGSADIERDHIYVPDAMRLVAELLLNGQAYGEEWIMPGCGPISGHQLARLLGELLQREVRVRAAPTWLLRVLGLFNQELGDFLQLVPEYVKPISYDGAKLEQLLGATARTPYLEALRTTIAVLREASASAQ
jgi:nucleoside-diphosphate-sugar epimerase